MENTILLARKGEIGVLTTLLVCLLLDVHVWGATFKGKVIDADTKQPIEGAVVVASWMEETLSIAEGGMRSKDVKETLTNKNGEWTISGPQGDGIAKWFIFIPGVYYTKPPEFIVFKPGYCSYPAGFGIGLCKGRLKTYNLTNSETIGEIVELPKLTDRCRETLSRNIPFIAADKNGKLPVFDRLLRHDIEEKGR